MTMIAASRIVASANGLCKRKVTFSIDKSVENRIVDKSVTNPVIAVAPRINRMFAILLSTTFPIARSGEPLAAARMFTINSVAVWINR